jgi:predicted nucleotidyltransferase
MGAMIDLITQHRAELEALCRKYHVRTLEVFGSAADGTWDPKRSDLDFLVEFLPEAASRMFHGYFDLKDDLERLFGREVDIVMPGAVRDPYSLETVNRHRKVLYAS